MIRCAHTNCKKNGRNRHGLQRFKCKLCGHRFTESRARLLGNLRIPLDKAERVIQALLEGCSIRSIARMFQIHRDTVCDLVLEVGERCESYFSKTLCGLTVSAAECDEIWSVVACKEKHRIRKGKSEEFGDCWVHTGLDPASKLLLSFHVGRRSDKDTEAFAIKLAGAVTGQVQVNTDGLTNYRTALPAAFGDRLHHVAVIKVYDKGDDEHRYSPARVVEVKKYARYGTPDESTASTSIIERSNLSIRTNLRRFTRLTIAISKSRRHHAAQFAMWALWYNFARPHWSLDKRTPAMAHGIADHRWTIRELLENTADHY